MATISSDYYLSSIQSTRTAGKSALGKDDFLKLLVTQLQNQDPSNPMDNTEYISQLASFSSLEQMQNVASSIDTLNDTTMQNQMIQYNTFVGKEIAYHEAVENKDGTTQINEGTGKVARVQYDGSTVYFVLDNGKKITASNISEVIDQTKSTSSTSSTVTTLLEASMLIGKKVTFVNADSDEKTEEVVSVSQKDGKLTFKLADGTSISADAINTIAAK